MQPAVFRTGGLRSRGKQLCKPHWIGCVSGSPWRQLPERELPAAIRFVSFPVSCCVSTKILSSLMKAPFNRRDQPGKRLASRNKRIEFFQKRQALGGRGGTGKEAGSSPENMDVFGIASVPASDRVAALFPVGLPQKAMKPSRNTRF